MEIVQVDLSNRRQVKDFLSLPARLYRDTPQWVPPLAGDERLRLNPSRYPFYRHSSAAFFLAYQDGEPLGRLAVLDSRPYNLHNHTSTAFFYLFESPPDPNVAQQLFQSAFDWARARRLTRIVGPKGFTALDGLGLLVQGFEHRPALGQPYHLPYYPDLLESLGFERGDEITSGYLAADIVFPERIHELASRLRSRRGLSIAHFRTRADLRRGLAHLKTLYNAVLEGTSDGTPLDDDDFNALANQMLWFANPRLIKIVLKGQQPVGFLLAYPDISTALQKTGGRLFPFGWLTVLRALRTTDWININGAGMIAEYRGLGGTAILYSELFQSIRAQPRYRHAEVVQVGMENEKMQRELENFGVHFNKLHRMYHQDL